jgi:amidase
LGLPVGDKWLKWHVNAGEDGEENSMIHEFRPSHYHLTIGSHEPVLSVADGDTVVTTTIDAWGNDENGAQVAPRGNPMTGPFYIEGAEPGDTLAVTFDELTPNRDSGMSLAVVAENVVEPPHVRWFPPQEEVMWRLDPERWTAAWLGHEGGESASPLAGLTLPLDPMLGCFGVAPALGQAISTATSGPYGGNMDYRGFRAGATVYLPVSAPGALFFLGDGHAVQGDGEIAGTGIETSFRVRFTVRLQKQHLIHWPRGEDAEYIFTIGNARPLDEAVQRATTAMIRWLGEDYGLDQVAAGTLLGQCVRYDLGNIFDPAYTVACKVSKRLLASLRPSSSL